MATETEFIETELKLRFALENLPTLTQLLDSIAKPQGGRQLNNTYYDSQDTILAGAKAALRIRENNGQYEQTLKTRGKSLAGMQLRGEWNWPITTPELDIELLQTADIQKHLPQGIELAALRPIFSTDFQRRTWLYQINDTLIEVALDSGQVQADGLTQPLCECECELVEGRADQLWRLAQTLGEQIPLWLSDVSKAERGYKLAKLSPSWKEWQAEPQSAAPMLQLENALVHWQRAAETIVWDDQAASVATLKSVLDQIKALVESLSCSPLAAAIEPWYSVELNGLDADTKHSLSLALSLQQAAYAYYQLSIDNH